VASAEKVRAAVVRAEAGLAASQPVARRETPAARAVAAPRRVVLQAAVRPARVVELEAVLRRTTPARRRRVA
jgi:hypothetical protein